jgi:histidinol-phosphate aminotransferase
LRKSLNCPPIVVFDEAYYEYATVHKDYPNSLEFHKLYPNLITLRTFSKIYGLAGLRVGYAVSNEKIISYMDRIRPPFNVNLLAQVAVIHSLADNKQHIKKSLEMVEHGKKYLYKQLNKIGLRYLPSAANFILINVSPYRGIDIFNKLLKKGIIVRAMDEYDFPDYIRVTIGKPKENRKFIYYLKKVLDKKL